jgi:hypothetical protein
MFTHTHTHTHRGYDVICDAFTVSVAITNNFGIIMRTTTAISLCLFVKNFPYIFCIF